jgi:type IV pilus assembly protein PilB
MQTFSQLLIKEKPLLEQDLFLLKREAEKQRLSIAQWLVKSKKLKPDKVTTMLATSLQITPLDINCINIKMLDFHHISLGQMTDWQVLLLKDKRLLMTDPSRYEIIQQLKVKMHQNIAPVLIKFNEFERLLEDIKIKLQHHTTQPSKTDKSFSIESKENDPSIQYINNILKNAVEENASDIHIEPGKKSVRIRFRVHGLLSTIQNPPHSMASQLINRIKIMAQLNIAETRLPQDGQCLLQLNHQMINTRISTCPTIHGEKMVIRLLKPNEEKPDLNTIGLSEKELALLIEAIKKPQGLILLTGPTGSGKTSTLYAALQALNTPDKNITTIEDPVEIQLEGINQVNTRANIGLTFEKVLRSLLRQDPDVIMLGEIRDKETAEIAIKSAQTGHLVFSTLHSNSSLKSISRLKNLGVKAYDINEALNLIIAQRLVRTLCSHCKKGYMPNQSTRDYFELPKRFLFEASGCEHCSNGYTTRIPIIEMLTYKEDNHSYQIHSTLKENAIKKVIRGETSLNEIKRVIET